MALAALPRRDPDARARLEAVARRAAPVVAARARVLPVAGPLGHLLPAHALQRGTVVAVDGGPGAGSTTVALGLAAAATAAGEWAVAVDPDGTLGGEAAAEAGIALDRFCVVRGVPSDRWAVVVAALLDGVTLVVADAPRGRSAVRRGDARRLVSRARERGAVLVVRGAWPAEAALRLTARGGCWHGLHDHARAVLTDRALEVHVDGRGSAARGRAAVLDGRDRDGARDGDGSARRIAVGE